MKAPIQLLVVIAAEHMVLVRLDGRISAMLCTIPPSSNDVVVKINNADQGGIAGLGLMDINVTAIHNMWCRRMRYGTLFKASWAK